MREARSISWEVEDKGMLVEKYVVKVEVIDPAARGSTGQFFLRISAKILPQKARNHDICDKKARNHDICDKKAHKCAICDNKKNA